MLRLQLFLNYEVVSYFVVRRIYRSTLLSLVVHLFNSLFIVKYNGQNIFGHEKDWAFTRNARHRIYPSVPFSLRSYLLEVGCDLPFVRVRNYHLSCWALSSLLCIFAWSGRLVGFCKANVDSLWVICGHRLKVLCNLALTFCKVASSFFLSKARFSILLQSTVHNAWCEGWVRVGVRAWPRIVCYKPCFLLSYLSSYRCWVETELWGRRQNSK